MGQPNREQSFGYLWLRTCPTPLRQHRTVNAFILPCPFPFSSVWIPVRLSFGSHQQAFCLPPEISKTPNVVCTIEPLLSHIINRDPVSAGRSTGIVHFLKAYEDCASLDELTKKTASCTALHQCKDRPTLQSRFRQCFTCVQSVAKHTHSTSNEEV